MIPTWVWLTYLAFVVGGFAALELPALLNRKAGDTLSENTRRWLFLDESPKRRGLRIAFVVTVIGIPAWFVLHIVTGLV